MFKGSASLISALFLLALGTSGCDITDVVKYAENIGLAKVTPEKQWDPTQSRPAIPLPPEILKDFDYTSNAALQEFTLIEKTSSHIWWQVRLNARDEAHRLIYPDGVYRIKMDIFISLNPSGEKAPLVVQLPPLGSQKNIQGIVGRYFAKKGTHSIAVYPDHGAASTNQLPENLHNYFVRNTVSVRQALDWILDASASGQHTDLVPASLDPRQIFSFGISLGGMRNVYLLSVEPRICKGAIAMGGADLPHVIAYSREPSVVRYRDHWLPLLGIDSPIDFESYLRERMPYETLRLANSIEGSRVSMLLSKHDTVVPTDNQVQLWGALGQPTLSSVDWPYYAFDFPEDWPTGHFDLAFAQQGMLKFFSQEFFQDSCRKALTSTL